MREGHGEGGWRARRTTSRARTASSGGEAGGRRAEAERRRPAAGERGPRGGGRRPREGAGGRRVGPSGRGEEEDGDRRSSSGGAWRPAAGSGVEGRRGGIGQPGGASPPMASGVSWSKPCTGDLYPPPPFSRGAWFRPGQKGSLVAGRGSGRDKRVH